jgi:hypothetical protein
MTIAVGWRDRDSIYVVADCAVTHGSDELSQLPFSPVRERHRPETNRAEAATAKIIAVSPTTLVAYAGYIDPAIKAVRLLRESLQSEEPFRACLQKMIHTFETAPDFTLLVAGHSDGRSELWIVRPSDPSVVCKQVYIEQQPAVLGSLPSEGVQFVRQLIEGFYNEPLLSSDPDRMLAAVLMTLQAYGQRVDLEAVRAGGVFFGMRLTDQAVAAQKDLFCLFFKDHPRVSLDMAGYLFWCMRNGVPIAFSSFMNEYNAFVTDAHLVTDSEIQEIPKPDSRQADYYGFVERTTGALVLVRCASRRPTHLFRITETGMDLKEKLLCRLRELPARSRDKLPETVPIVLMDDDDMSSASAR